MWVLWMGWGEHNTLKERAEINRCCGRTHTRLPTVKILSINAKHIQWNLQTTTTQGTGFMTFAESLVVLQRLLNTYFYVRHSMSFDCCSEFELSSGGLCSEVLLYSCRCTAWFAAATTVIR